MYATEDMIEKQFQEMELKIEELGFTVKYDEEALWEEARSIVEGKIIDAYEQRAEERKMEMD